MDKFFLRAFFFVGGLMCSVFALAQDSTGKEKPHMAELMRSNGKIYVVVAVLLIILAGIFFYLVNLDRKISRLEKNDN
jgi:CcmD family protein